MEAMHFDDPMEFKDIVVCAIDELTEVTKKRTRSCVPITSDEFKQLFPIVANKRIKGVSVNVDFVIDDENKDTISELYFYLTKSNQCKLNVEKGILLLGNLGSGKTVIMKSICDIWNMYLRKKITITSSHAIVDMSRSKIELIDNLATIPLFIDDVGKETDFVNSFGTASKPVNELLLSRYENGSLTFATGNYTLKTLIDHYGETVVDRLEEMFNVIVLKGKSRRK